jgi:hypothetical protein
LYFFVILIGGAIYINSSNVPNLLNCLFSDNSASSSGFGKDIVFNSDSSLYNEQNIEGTCSSSSTPHITGTSISNTFNFSGCKISASNYLDYCKRPVLCNESKSEIICKSSIENMVTDAPCIWVMNEKGDGGMCNSELTISCENYKMMNNVFLMIMLEIVIGMKLQKMVINVKNFLNKNQHYVQMQLIMK